MLNRKTLRTIHLAGTIWFIVCIGFVFVMALRQAGFHWWMVFSLSGHGALAAFILISLYLAVFRSFSRSQEIRIEHPLTSTTHYTAFYVMTPFLGGLAGCLGYLGIAAGVQLLVGIALGTLIATFLVWVVVDPVTAVLEVVLSPPGRRHRAQRLAQAKARREDEQRGREHLLAEILEKEESERRRWEKLLKPEAQKLAELLTADTIDFEQAQRQAADIGASAWQVGGLGSMRQLREMAINLCKQKYQNGAFADYISVWWDGIGSWRNPSLHKTANP